MNRVYPMAIIMSLIVSSNALAVQYADMILTNANIYGHNNADTIAIHDGYIMFVGKATKADTYRNQDTEVIDLEQAYIMPGFIDNHNHVFEAASEAGSNCTLNVDASLEEQIPYLIKCSKNANPKNWLMGYGFSLDTILNENNRYTPLDVIDRIFPKQAVVLMEHTSHSMWVNSVALKLAGITKDSPEPRGGKILKDERTGELNGIVFDNAGDIIMDMAWNSLENQFKQSYDGLMIGLKEAAAHGITTIGDGRLYWQRGWYDVWQQAESDGDLTTRVSLRPWIYPAESMMSQLAFLKTVQSSDKSRLLLVDQVKMYSDGIIINGTAKVLSPYLDTYIPDEPYDINYIPPSQMTTWLDALNKIGYSAHIHAIGDGTVRESLDAIGHVRNQGAKKPYTLTHVELVDTKDIPRFAKLDVTADFQVGSDYVASHDHQWAKAFLGVKRTHSLMNPRAIFNTGANVTLSSDWNVHDINPLVGIENILKMGNTGLPDVYSAINAYTINAAESLGISDIAGSITLGKSADFAILDQDITRLPVNDIANTEILMTILQGDIVFETQGISYDIAD
ncbi:amidohydrolase [Shewanella sp. D64]|uniref:amidohydrolase n=1 Tax=unclassified Shewanella TaxID=196818 RepID=UPI0022BA291D|nr:MULTISPECIES: amidohydrolase [unclassified Shewanella]MEC4726705.1 amidohydrolase [Shewanella sp. D64]MEC4738931.1 amidohydrolase [Shewanella sp. E94]WBJ96916.1 amidohydrolase [Shewanella sp. MTB7]